MRVRACGRYDVQWVMYGWLFAQWGWWWTILQVCAVSVLVYTVWWCLSSAGRLVRIASALMRVVVRVLVVTAQYLHYIQIWQHWRSALVCLGLLTASILFSSGAALLIQSFA